MVSVNFNSVNLYNVSKVPPKDTSEHTVSKPEVKKQSPAFRAQAYQSAVTVHTILTTKDEKKKYNALIEELDSEYRKKLDFALKSGLLLKNNSNDKSTVLDNLYKILKEERDPGLDKTTILNECLDILNNPYVITQTCEDIPEDSLLDFDMLS